MQPAVPRLEDGGLLAALDLVQARELLQRRIDRRVARGLPDRQGGCAHLVEDEDLVDIVDVDVRLDLRARVIRGPLAHAPSSGTMTFFFFFAGAAAGAADAS